MTRDVIIAALLIAAYLAAVIRFAVLAARRPARNAPAPPPGPGRHQAARWPDEDGGIRGWSDEEIAYPNGETGELPHG